MKNLLKKLGFLFSVLLLILVKSSGAQTLALTAVSFTQDSANFGSTDTLSFTLKNTGAVSFSGNCSIKCQVNSDSIIVLDTTSSTLIAGGTRGFNYKFSIVKPSFKSFTNIIVIWPYTPSPGVICDTTTINLNVKSPEGIPETKNPPTGFTVYPNPANTLIELKATGSGFGVENVRIYNKRGELQAVFTGNIRQLNIAQLSAGLYLLQVENSDHQISNLRFIKQ
jgi:hypothetical protein